MDTTDTPPTPPGQRVGPRLGQRDVESDNRQVRFPSDVKPSVGSPTGSYPTVVRGRGDRPDTPAPWLRSLMVDVTEARLAEERVERAQRKRALAIYAAHDIHKASYRWLGERLGLHHTRIIQLVKEGRRIAEAGGLTDDMLRFDDPD